MKHANIAFLGLLVNILETLPRTNTGLAEKKEKMYIKSGKPYVQVDGEWCNKVAEELRRIILEEEIANGTEISEVKLRLE